MTIIPTKKTFHLGRLCFYILSLLALYLPKWDYMMRESICYWYQNYGILCPTCGGTRSFLHFMHFHFTDAFHYNSVLTLGVYPFLMLLMLQDAFVIISNSFFGTHYASLLLFFMNLFNIRRVS